MTRPALALALLLSACDDTVRIVEPEKLAPSVVCSAVIDRYQRCTPDDPFPEKDRAGCEQQVDTGGYRKYWECVAQLDCSNHPGSCESLKP